MTRAGSEPGTDFRVEHHRVQRIARELAATRDLPALLERLAAFRVEVAAHFSQEEAPGGFFEFVRGRSAANLGRLSALEREHAEFMQAVGALDQRIRECLAGPIADLLREAAGMAEQLMRHEAAESRLLVEALYTDGGADA